MSQLSFELKSLKTRFARLQEIFNSVGPYPPSPEEWTFWLEKMNALSGQFTSLERELVLELLEGWILEPAALPVDPKIPGDVVPNILLRSKLAPEVLNPVEIKEENTIDDPMIDESRKKLYRNALKTALARFEDLFADIHDSVSTQTSTILAMEQVTLASGAASGTASRPTTNKSSSSMISLRGSKDSVNNASNASNESLMSVVSGSTSEFSEASSAAMLAREAFLENALRWMYTGQS